MKIQALGPLSGASGEREKGDIFDVKKEYGESLIARGYAVEVPDSQAPDKPAKAASAKE